MNNHTGGHGFATRDVKPEGYDGVAVFVCHV